MNKTSIGLVAVIVLIAINLRPPMAGVGPIFDQIQAATGISNFMGSLLTTLPIAMIGLGAAFGAPLRRTLGEQRGIFLGVALIGLAALVRGFWASAPSLLVTSLVAGGGIALVQVLMASFSKRVFPKNTGLIMAVYTTGIMAGAALGAMSAPPLAAAKGWAFSLSIWAIPAFVAMALWPLALRRLPRDVRPPQLQDILAKERGALLHKAEAWGTSTSDDTGDLLLELSMARPTGIKRRVDARTMNFWGNLRAWELMGYFGIGTAAFTLVLAWLPPYYTNLGKSETFGGMMLGSLTLIEVFAGFLVSACIHRFPDRRKLLWIATGLLALGLILLLVAPLSQPIAIVVCIGLGSGSIFPLALILALDHLTNPDEAGSLTDFVQGGGYLLASLSPAIAGLIRDNTTSLTLAWGIMLFFVLVMFAMTFLFGPNSYHRIESAAKAPKQ